MTAAAADRLGWTAELDAQAIHAGEDTEAGRGLRAELLDG